MLDMLFGGQAALFGVPAVAGTAVFVIRLAFMLAGGAAGDLDVDADAGPGDLGHADPGHDAASILKVISFQAVVAFAMGFGWAGLAGMHGMGWSAAGSTALGVAGGAAMAWLLAVLLRGVRSLHATGTIGADDAVGSTGSVYATVPASGGGRGQVRVVIGDRARIFNAESREGELPTGAAVRVVGVRGDQSVVVSRAEAPAGR